MWDAKRLEDVAKIFSGYAFSASDMTQKGIPIIKIANIQAKRVLSEVQDFYPKDLYSTKLEKYILNKEDILVAMTGAGSVGKIGKMQEVDCDYLVNQRVGIIRVNKSISNPIFVYLTLTLEHYEEMLYNIGIGAGQPNISPKDIGKLVIKLPPLSTQHRIADILSVYDDLIENNNRRIDRLEQAAQQIYKEWFVRFRFPGYETTHFTKGIPDGWEVKKLCEIANIQMGQSPKSEFYNENEKGLPFHQGVTAFNNRYPTHITYCTEVKKVANKGDILLSVRAPVGRINIANRKLVIGRGLCSISSINNNQCYLYYLLNNYFHKEDIIGNGSIFSSVGKEELYGIKLLLPPIDIIRNFELIVKEIDLQISRLTNESENLIKQRDLLLPRLMGGKLEV